MRGREAVCQEVEAGLVCRAVLAGVAAASAANWLAPALAQQNAAPAASSAPVFGQGEVIKRARELAKWLHHE